jgi:hypothetical protein
MKGGLLAILEKPRKGESDDMEEAPESSEGDTSGEKKDAMRDFLDAIKADDVDAATLAAERFVMCCHDEE